MTEATPDSKERDPATGEVTDEMLPDDLQPTDDNPLARPADEEDAEGGLSLGPDGPQSGGGTS